MERNKQSGNIALIALGAILLLGGIAAFARVGKDRVNPAEEGTANKVGGSGCGVGAQALVVGFVMRKNKS
jgi:hypothetical protein